MRERKDISTRITDIHAHSWQFELSKITTEIRELAATAAYSLGSGS